MPNWCAQSPHAGVNVLVMVLQGRKSSPQKSRPLESGHRRHGVWIAIEYSYKLGQKINLIFVRTRLVFAETVTYIATLNLYMHDFNEFRNVTVAN